MTSLLNAMSGNFFAGLCLACREPSVLTEKGKGFRTAANGEFTMRYPMRADRTGIERTGFCGGWLTWQNRSAAGGLPSDVRGGLVQNLRRIARHREIGAASAILADLGQQGLRNPHEILVRMVTSGRGRNARKCPKKQGKVEIRGGHESQGMRRRAIVTGLSAPPSQG
ncbi:hypothetical protein JQ616_08795 [Bradyrhizobium tropiciagri]|uniref:hypothetical protein n=1 Tax=Bradyrhizobium tropiciagri TaxID=312253 RepID=UPI001BA6DE31|nr:hypothetical protein [Bradyrhizobium tropiciagri]MBR0895042.1 hypothetical protein [Bradyrhizobium tropiciagri]